MTIETQIQAALIALLVPVSTVATSDITSPATPVSLPFVQFAPTAGVAYLDVRSLLRATPDNYGSDFTGSVLRRGVFQVDAIVPDGAGEAPGLTLAGLVVARFAIGTVLVAGGRRLQLLKEATIAPPVKDAPWVRYPVSIPYLLIQ